MDSTKQLDFPKTETPLELDWSHFDEAFQKIGELPRLDTLLELDSCPFPSHNWNINEFKTLEDVTTGNFRLDCNVPFTYEDVLIDAKAPSVVVASGPFGYNKNVKSEVSSENQLMGRCDFGTSSCLLMGGEKRSGGNVSGRKRLLPLELEEIQKHFDVPITRAAKEMNVGVTVLKKRCRELNIMRWPHRKIKSLKSLISSVKELGLDNEILMLEEHKRLLEQLPDLELTDRTKKLRQACFKANYKKRKISAALS